MSENIIIAIIEATTGIGTAILTGIFGYWLARKQSKIKYFEGLRQKRFETYPELLKITQNLGKTETSLEDHKKAREELKEWIVASHGGYLTLSKNTLFYFNKLKDLLKKNAGDGKQYSKEQLDKIFNARNALRGSMTDDISVVKNADLPTKSQK